MMQELAQSYPQITLAVISLFVVLAMTLVTKYATNQARIKELKEKNKACQKMMKDLKDQPEKLALLQKDMLSCSGELMKHSFKPMLITFVPIILLIGWIKNLFSTTSIAGSWIWWYLGFSIVFSIFIRKLLKVQ